MEKEAAVELTGGARVDSLPALIAHMVAAEGGAIVLRKKNRGIWNAVTWAQLDREVAAIRRGLRAMGFGRGDVAAAFFGDGALAASGPGRMP